MDIDDGQLIDLVRQFTLIWDSKHKDFKNRDEKANAWRTIGEIMNLEAAECEIRWASLRTIYGKEKKKFIPSGSAPVKEWEWLKKLDFLDNHIRRRRTKGNISTDSVPSTSSPVQSETLWDSMSTIVENPLYEGTASPNSDSFSDSIPFKKQRTNITVHFDENNPFPMCASSNVAGTSSSSVADTSSFNIAGVNLSTTGGACSSNSPILSRSQSKNSVSKQAPGDTEKKRKKSQSNILESLENCWEKFNMLLDQPKPDENSDTAFGKLVGYELSNIEDEIIKRNKKRDILKILYD